ncbi:hypothetical protein ACFST9_00815 [Hymenobacter monticola]|uniref:Uncharacterized protein n=1 Tax=Hymenobacter monticola TaxID=1705399 RepID=A0ABY4B3E0_9BACT|nr:hypothetical protein [Hymenobacter monticola]UOE33495.1 hypothetical protein MTP16_20515 [Hymenobacter monticola]
MKPRFARAIVLLCLLYCRAALARVEAQCSTSPWITVWPDLETKLIQPRQVFLFSGSYSGGKYSLEKMLPQFGTAIRATLWSAHDSVDLLVLGHFEYTGTDAWDAHSQLLLQPSRPLLPDSVYELRVARADENLYFLFRNGQPKPGQRRATAYRWQVSAVPDEQAPAWVATPTVQQAKYEANSEGIENYVMFSYPLRDASPCLLRATVRHVSSRLESRFMLQTWHDRLPIGWFTCGGNVRLKSEEAYTVSFEAIDAAGNRAVATGTPIPFRAPIKVACCWGN